MYANKVKKIAAVHDLSGMGRVSLTVVIPILSSIKVGVQPSVISQHRIGNDQTVRSAKIPDKIRNNLNLSRRTQISGIDSIEFYLQLLPLGNNFRHFVRQVEEGETGILRMIG